MITLNITTLIAIISLSVIIGAAVVASIINYDYRPTEKSNWDDDGPGNDAW